MTDGRRKIAATKDRADDVVTDFMLKRTAVKRLRWFAMGPAPDEEADVSCHARGTVKDEDRADRPFVRAVNVRAERCSKESETRS